MKKVDLVSHVHWDPAWYLPYEQYRITLIPLMKDLLIILETNKEFGSFMFDGQVDAIDDYLVLFPENRPRIEKLVREEKLIIGPWYIQPEEFLISGETHIRNMLIGLKKAREYDAAMPATYLCDMVGHIAQMPQLVKGFGMNYFVGWRGILDGKERNEAAFIWEAPDGSQVIAKALTDGYYHLFPNEPQEFIKKIDEISEKLSPYEKGESVLMMQGADHRPAIANIPDLIRCYNQEKGEEIISQVSLLDHLKKIRASDCKSVKGEMRAAYYHGTFILSGILTVRMSIKYKNEYVSRELERWAEPFSAFSVWAANAAYPKALLDYAWIKQLKCSFHDCIYGGHVDAVTKDVFDAYKKTLEITDWINGENLYALSRMIKTVGDGDNVTIFNPSPWERINETVDFVYWADAEKNETEFIAFTENGVYLPVQVNGIKKNVKRYTGFSGNQWQQCDPVVYNEFQLSVTIPAIPGLGYLNIGIQGISNAHEPAKTDLILQGLSCENSLIRVWVEENGCVSVFDKETDRLYSNIHQIEESGDKGDHYNYSRPLEDRIHFDKYSPAECYVAAAGPCKITFGIKRRWMLPSCVEDGVRSQNCVENTLTTFVTIYPYSKAVHFKTIIDNQSKDHRYRLYIPSRISGKTIQSGSQFYINTRAREAELPEIYVEKPMNNHPQRLFTDISDAKGGIAVLSRGFSEYDARENGDVFFTMLRCVSHLSKPTNSERFYHNAGPEYPTPDAQETGLHEIEYALYFHGCNDTVIRKCDEFYAPARCMQGNPCDGVLPPSASYLSLSGDGIMLSAIKRAEKKDAWIIRVYNASSHATEGMLSAILPICSAYKTNLNEEREEALPIAEHAVHFPVKPYQIYTMEIHFNEKGEKE